MLLFRYFGSHGLETLQQSLLKTATVSALNDPFELLYQLTGSMTMSKAKRQLNQRIKSDGFLAMARNYNPRIKTRRDLKKFMANNRGKIARNLVANYSDLRAENFAEDADRILRIVCFSEATVDRLDEILIWSHYANKHQGVRIGFEFPDEIEFPFKIIPVQYQKERVALDLTQGLHAPHVKEAIGNNVKVKSLAWEYEREHRMLASPKFCTRKQLQNSEFADFVPFKKEWVRHVDMGVRASQKDIQAMKEFLLREYPTVQLRLSSFHSTDYALEYRVF